MKRETIIALLGLQTLFGCYQPQTSLGIKDTDGDGVADYLDAFPEDYCEAFDTDKDGVGDAADTDDDNDGVPDYVEELYFYYPLEDGDEKYDLYGPFDPVDADSHPVLEDTGNGYWLDHVDLDLDGLPNSDPEESDADGDGYTNEQESDFDGDGLNNDEDEDDDGDGIADVDDADSDSDGLVDARIGFRPEERTGLRVSDPYDAMDTPLSVAAPLRPCGRFHRRQWYVGDMHVRTSYSDSASTVTLEDQLDVAAMRRLDFVVIADEADVRSFTDRAYNHGRVLVIPGYDINFGGHAIVAGVDNYISPAPHTGAVEYPAPVSDIARAVSARGGLFVLTRMFDGIETWPWFSVGSPINAVEIWTGQISPYSAAATPLNHYFTMALTGGRISEELTSDAYAKSVTDTSGGRTQQVFAYWHQLLNTWARLSDAAYATGVDQPHPYLSGKSLRDYFKIPPVAGSNAGDLFGPGSPVTHVLAEELSVRGIRDGLRDGKVLLTRTRTSAWAEITLTAPKYNGVRVGGIIGDTMKAINTSGDYIFTVKTGGIGYGALQLLKNGKPICDAAPAPDFTDRDGKRRGCYYKVTSDEPNVSLKGPIGESSAWFYARLYESADNGPEELLRTAGLAQVSFQTAESRLRNLLSDADTYPTEGTAELLDLSEGQSRALNLWIDSARGWTDYAEYERLESKPRLLALSLVSSPIFIEP